MASSSLTIERLGLVDYQEALALQRRLHSELISGARADTLLACSHDPIMTFGTSTKNAHLLTDARTLETLGISVATVERGGSVTYHGPEQAVLYPIINLTNHKRDVGWYMRSLEEVVIRTLSEYEITGLRVPGKAGIWIDLSTKIAFCGVKISRWCTLHGLSLNVHDCSKKFELIDPCGLGPIKVISMPELTLGDLAVEVVAG